MDKLPDKVVRLDVLRVEYGKKKLCSCQIPHYEVDYQNRLVTCLDCGAVLDHFTALCSLASFYERLNSDVERLLEQRREIANYKPHLIVMKKLEQQYRGNNYSMVPLCPHCKEPFDLPELTHWCNRRFLKKKEE